MPYKLTEDGSSLEIQKSEDGKFFPIWINEENQSEVPFDADNNMATLKKQRLSESEARKEMMESKKALQEMQSLFEGIENIAEFKEKAVLALATVQEFDDKQKKTATELEEQRKAAGQAWQNKIADIEKGYKSQIEEKDSLIQKSNRDFENYLVERLFLNSPFIKDDTYMPPDVAYNTFGKKIKIKKEDGKRVIYGVDHNEVEIFSQKDPGAIAQGDELIELLIKAHPQRDIFIKNKNPGGSGQGGTKDTTDPKDVLSRMYPTMK